MDEDAEDLFAYRYGPDWPNALQIMGSAFLSGRPINEALGPKQQLDVVIAAAEYRAPTPRRAGKGKPLPASDAEGEQETTQRKNAQKNCRKLILPKTKHESADVFIRRLDAHRNAPDALVAPMMPPEDEMLFAKRCVAVKETAEMPNVLILPKGAKEVGPEFEERLSVAKKVSCLVFPRGHHETSAQFKARLAIAKKCKRSVLPKSEQEPDKGFSMRIEMQIVVEHVVHPFDPSRENEKQYYRRLEACKEKTGISFEPGDTMAVAHAIGEERAQKPPAAAKASAPAPAAAEVLQEALDEEAKFKEQEAAAQAAADAKAAEEAAKAAEKESEEERVAARVEEMKLKQQAEQQRLEEERNKKHSFAMETVYTKQIGFMPLKKLLMERGVPKDQVFACANKFALVEVAKKWGDELKIHFSDEDPVAVS